MSGLVDALRLELAGYELRGLADRAVAVRAELARLGVSDDDDLAGTGVGVVETAGDAPAAVPGESVEEAGGSSARFRSGRRKAE